MAISPAAKALNVSAHTLGDLQTLARAEPKQAETYLQGVERQLRVTGKTAEADTIKAVLGKTGELVERMAAAAEQLKTVFPESAADWGKVQLQRVDTVGYGTPVPAGAPAQYVTGELKASPEGLTFTTEGGRELKLGPSPLSRKHFQMGNDMMEGFVGDGRMTLHGTLGEDGKSFNVEAYALNTDGKFDTFTFGRVSVNGETVTIDGARGPVEVQDAELKRVLASMPRLAVIVPGEPEEKDGKLVLTAKSQGVLMALARFKEAPPPAAAGATVSVKANMADNHFVMKPLTFPAGQLDRSNHMSRLWVRGWPEYDAKGEPSEFKASYLSKQLDQRRLQTGSASQDADPVQAAVMQDVV